MWPSNPEYTSLAPTQYPILSKGRSPPKRGRKRQELRARWGV
jgi:hypothetical protein